jgi:hypothetical protein
MSQVELVSDFVHSNQDVKILVPFGFGLNVCVVLAFGW